MPITTRSIFIIRPLFIHPVYRSSMMANPAPSLEPIDELYRLLGDANNQLQIAKDQATALEEKVEALEEKVESLEQQVAELKEQRDAGDDPSVQPMETSSDTQIPISPLPTTSQSGSSAPATVPAPVPAPAPALAPTPAYAIEDIDFTVWANDAMDAIHIGPEARSHIDDRPWKDLETKFLTEISEFEERLKSKTASKLIKGSTLNPLEPTQYCLRGTITKIDSIWTLEEPGKYCCKKCFRNKWLCVKYNEQNRRVELLPLPERLRPQEFGPLCFTGNTRGQKMTGIYEGVWG
ncbi:hypothetical protein D6C91_10080 [Aureobasidium pullulans]|uniref:Uncharacterized protein n=1 Tax=Aureobasidium pullulans TaxID=5580 RepID=A0A4S9SB42_AURPU|nr:hypothetical protein D6C91_10080 [Aureobasidium pullulans]